MSLFNGVSTAVITNIQDPLGAGRIQVCLSPSAGGAIEWAKVVSAALGSYSQRGQLGLEDEVLVAFEEGDTLKPYVIGTLWNGTKPAQTATGTQAVHLPTGAVLHPILGGPANSVECVAAPDLERQVAPWLASTTCLLKTLALLKPLISVIEQLPTPTPGALEEFAKAAANLAPCLLMGTPASALPFVHDLLCLTLQSLECLRDRTMPPADLERAAVGIQGVLDLGEPFFVMANLAPVHLSVIANPGALTSDIAALQSAVAALGGCG